MYRPIFSKDLKEYENKKVSVLGKVVNIEEEKKLIRLKLLDPFGYIDVVLFEYYEVKPFDTVIVLGNVSKDNNENYYILGKYLVKI
ncbi:MAG: OB-fold nucleic acid binding domain-containing protein, partial [Nanopusillaceae archaeon]